MKDGLQRKGSSFLLGIAIGVIGTIVGLLCLFALPAIWVAAGSDKEYSEIAYAFYGILTVLYVASVPFYYALYQSLKLVRYIEKDKAFSLHSVKALKHIAWCGVAIAVLFVAMEPLLFIWAQHDDAPGIILFGMIIAGASLTISVFAAVLQRLLSEAINMKDENELTV